MNQRPSNRKSKRRNTREVWAIERRQRPTGLYYTEAVAEMNREEDEKVVRYVPAKGSRRG